MTSLVNGAPRRLGSLPPVGPLSFGQWRFTGDDPAANQGLVETALAAGMNLVDTADVYGLDWGGTGFGSVEERLGQVLARAPQLRDRMVLATKGGIRPPIPYDSSPRAITAACDDSLRRLGVEVIDLYQIHRPDLYTHPAALAEALDALRDAGKIREIGVSNYTPAQTTALQAHLDAPLVSTQPEISAVTLTPMRDGTLDLCMERGMTPMAWSPLGGGKLSTGDGLRPELIAVTELLAERESVDLSHIALAFVLAHPSAPIAITGTQNAGRLADSVRAVDVHLDRGDVYEIITASQGFALP